MDRRLTPDKTHVSIQVTERSGIGEARRVAADMAAQMELDERDAGRLAIVVTEAASNVVHHAGTGEILLRNLEGEAWRGVEVLSLDGGPGIADVESAMRDGETTEASRGVGLGAMRRMSDQFDIYTATDPRRRTGTAILMRVLASPKARIDRAAIDRPVLELPTHGAVAVPRHDELIGGDIWAVTALPTRVVCALVDGLGHGEPAFRAALAALGAYDAHTTEGPRSIIDAMHTVLRGERGAVAAVADISWQSGKVRYAGVGNVSGRIFAPGDSTGLVSLHGTLGQGAPTIQEFEYDWPTGGLLLMHTDGIARSWVLDDSPGLMRCDPVLIAGVIYRDHARRRDDASVLVVRGPIAEGEV